MTAINKEHLKKVHVICETEADVIKGEEFIELNRCAGMKAHLFDKSTNGHELLEEFNIAVVNTGNEEFVKMIVDRYDFLGHDVRIFELKDEK